MDSAEQRITSLLKGLGDGAMAGGPMPFDEMGNWLARLVEAGFTRKNVSPLLCSYIFS